MFHRVRLIPQWSVGLTLTLVLLLGACSGSAPISKNTHDTHPAPNGNPTATPIGGPTATPTPPGGGKPFRIIERLNTAYMTPEHTATATAQCDPGEQLVSGGFNIPAAYNYSTPYANFPSSLTTWTVSADNLTSSIVPLEADVYCFQGSVSLNMTIQSAVPGLPFVSCPSMSFLTGGGFRLSRGLPYTIIQSRPLGQAWFVGSTYPGGTPVPATLTMYALCATSHVAPGAQPESSFAALANSGGGATITGCPSFQTLTGGGFADFDSGGYFTMFFNFAGFIPAIAVNQWMVGVQNTDTVHAHGGGVYGVCVYITH